MRLGNDTSREIFADNFARNRGKNFVQPNSKKWLCHFFDMPIYNASATVNKKSDSKRKSQ